MNYNFETNTYTPPPWSSDSAPCKDREELYQLELMDGGLILESFALLGSPYFTLGRGGNNNIVIQAQGVSRHHAIL